MTMSMSKTQVFKLLVMYKRAQDPILSELMADILHLMDKNNTNTLQVQLPETIARQAAKIVS
jgi:hypothetical protein